MTNWVTIRVPESDRDDAKDIRPDDATHGDCLVAGAKALAGQEPVYAIGDDEPADHLETTVEVTPELDGDAANELVAELEQRLSTDVDEPADRIINRIEDLETELTRQHEELGR